MRTMNDDRVGAFRAFTDPCGRRGRLLFAASLCVVGATWACVGPPPIPPARPVINAEGLRLSPPAARMDATAAWVNAQLEEIDVNPGFLISTQFQSTVTYPWESLEIKLNPRQDTAAIAVDGLGSDAQTPYMLYAHLKLLEARGELGQWMPGGETLEGLDRELAILARVGESWLYGRSVFSTIAHPVWDEIMYASELGFLRPLVLVARPDEFPQEREAWETEDPGGLERYATWFRRSFDREPPGLRPSPEGAAAGDSVAVPDTTAVPDTSAVPDTVGVRDAPGRADGVMPVDGTSGAAPRDLLPSGFPKD